MADLPLSLPPPAAHGSPPPQPARVQRKPKDGAEILIHALTTMQRKSARPRAERPTQPQVENKAVPANRTTTGASPPHGLRLPRGSLLASARLDKVHRQKPAGPPAERELPWSRSRDGPRRNRNGDGDGDGDGDWDDDAIRDRDRDRDEGYTSDSHYEAEFSRGGAQTAKLDDHDGGAGGGRGGRRRRKEAEAKGRLFDPESDVVPLVNRQTRHPANGGHPPQVDSLAYGRPHQHSGGPPQLTFHSLQTAAMAPPAGRDAGKKLFDPRVHDPVRFSGSIGNGGGGGAAGGGKRGSANASAASASDGRSIGSGSVLTGTTTSRSKGSDHGGSPGKSAAQTDSRRSDGSNSFVNQLKRAYKVIMELEKSLKDEEACAKAREEELKAREAREDMAASAHVGGGGGTIKLTNGTLRLASHGAPNGPANGHSRGVAASGGFNNEYWVRLAKSHRDLAEAHRHFLDMALDQRLPASLHSLPQKYNIPTRLWQTAFHQLLERLRHALPPAPPHPSTSSPFSPSPSPSSSWSSPAGFGPGKGGDAAADAEAAEQLLDHMEEFIYFAYRFYTGLLEEQGLGAFRSVWIEQLGDLARYRMAVAGLAAKYKVRSGTDRDDARGSAPVAERTGPDEDEARWDSGGDDQDRERAAEQAGSKQRGSIGVAALGDWDYEEQETWRRTAKEWYAQGLAEMPGTGRLHHHLALLSKGDELRALYHYVKSLTASHPYTPARESILPFFEQEHQSRRTRSEVSTSDLFVRLHGMLFTKIQLDDFDDELARFMERLAEDRVLLAKGAGRSAVTDAAWIMMATVNIAGVLQYGADDGVLRSASASAPSGGRGGKPAGPRGTSASTPAVRPQAILLNRRDQDPAGPTNDDASERHSCSPVSCNGDDMIKTLAALGADESPLGADEEPLAFRNACLLCFGMLDEVLRRPLRPYGVTRAVLCPYVTVVLTFLAQACQKPEALRRVERFVPWARLVGLCNMIPKDVDVRTEPASIKLVGGPLPEDWCMRGMEWAGRTLFGRGYWKPKGAGAGARPKTGNGGGDLYPAAESEMDVLDTGSGDPDREDGQASSDGVVVQVEGDVDPEAMASALVSLRWKRVAVVGGWAAKNVHGLGYDPAVHRFAVLNSLKNRINRWKAEAEREEAEKTAMAQRAFTAFEGHGETREAEVEDEASDEEDVDDESDSDLVKALKARRRELRAALRAARAPQNKAARPVGPYRAPPRVPLHTFPGYTILVFDTNILVGMLSIVSDLLDARVWTVVVPLAVVTELDGLKLNEGSLGRDAAEAVRFLEARIRTHAKYLKVQTSRGNYLHDLSIRSEDIDFAGDGHSTTAARNMDDLILRAAIWQDRHFSNRLPILNPAADRSAIAPSTAQVALVTFDRNLRLKARARGIVAADEKDIASLLSPGDVG